MRKTTTRKLASRPTNRLGFARASAIKIKSLEIRYSWPWYARATRMAWLRGLLFLFESKDEDRRENAQSLLRRSSAAASWLLVSYRVRGVSLDLMGAGRTPSSCPPS